jgi:predicted hydrolase (HD superfamily)
MALPSREAAHQLLATWIKNPALLHHCQMVAWAMEGYAHKLGQDPELWYQTGLLHDLDWEAFPDEHPNKAVAEWLGEYPEEVKHAILAHAPERTQTTAESQLDKYLFACDEISGFIHAVSLMRPTGLSDMAAKSVIKKLKDKSFAANVSRDDINHGVELIEIPLADHITFLISVFTTH